MYLPLLLTAIVLTCAIYLLLQYSSRALVIDNDDDLRGIDDAPVREHAKAA
jgi:hypothetical protein